MNALDLAAAAALFVVPIAKSNNTVEMAPAVRHAAHITGCQCHQWAANAGV